ncbi:MAG: DUF748 domain-containing protein, partial [Steroidobacteraceae bacterium]
MSEQGRLNLLDLAGPAPAAGTDAGTAGGSSTAGAGTGAQPPWTVSAPDISVEGFKVSAEDRQFKPAALLQLSPLNLHVAGFNTSPDDTLDVTLNSTVNTSGKLTVRARVTPRAGSVSAHIEAQRLGLAALQP